MYKKLFKYLEKYDLKLQYQFLPGFRSRSRMEPGYLAGAGAALNICLIIHENYKELNII